MGQTKSKHHEGYTMAFKLQAVRLADTLNVMAIEVADCLGIHPVMLYRWRMEKKNRTLHEKKIMKRADPPPKKIKPRIDPVKAKEDELLKANKRIKTLERTLASTQEELDILKKARRFFANVKR